MMQSQDLPPSSTPPTTTAATNHHHNGVTNGNGGQVPSMPTKTVPPAVLKPPVFRPPVRPPTLSHAATNGTKVAPSFPPSSSSSSSMFPVRPSFPPAPGAAPRPPSSAPVFPVRPVAGGASAPAPATFNGGNPAPPSVTSSTWGGSSPRPSGIIPSSSTAGSNISNSGLPVSSSSSNGGSGVATTGNSPASHKSGTAFNATNNFNNSNFNKFPSPAAVSSSSSVPVSSTSGLFSNLPAAAAAPKPQAIVSPTQGPPTNGQNNNQLRPPPTSSTVGATPYSNVAPLRPPLSQPGPPRPVPPSFSSTGLQGPMSQLSFAPSAMAPRPLAPPAFAPPSRGPPPLAGNPSSFAPPPIRPPPLAGNPTSFAPPPLRPPPLAGPPSFAPQPIAPPPLAPPPLTSSSALGPATSSSSYPTPASQPSRPPPQNFQHQRQYPQPAPSTASSQARTAHVPPYQSSNVTRDGWNSSWGTESVDLLQQRQVLPPTAVEPPRPVLAQDFLRNCIPDILRCSFTKIPETKSLLSKAKMPFGIVIHPFKDLEQLPVVSCQQIVRCRSCRTYINPFVVFRGERRWECNLCFRVNDLPDEFQYDPVSQTYGDPSRRPEVREATIEYIAPSEYMLRPPQPAVYLWLLDTSRQAVDTGYLKVVCDTLRQNLDLIPGDRRALIGFMTFSATVQFYLMPEGSTSVNMLEVGDLNDIFVPHPDDLLVNIHQQREQIDDLLTNLPQTHADTIHTQSALGPALTAAYKLLYPLGGRLTVLTTLLPSIGPGALQPREDPNQRAATDIMHLNPATDFYKKLALDCSGQQIAVDLFTLNSQYIDLATLSGMSKFSGGCIHHFPNFHVHMNPPSVAPFVACLTRYITRKIGFEAVMRIRATRGLSITNFHGHFFVRSPDLLSLPNINPDAGFAMQVGIEDPLHNIRSAAFQAALLYTSSRGERRIRVHTLCLPVTGNLHDIVNTCDQQAAVALLARMAVDRCLASTSTDARDALVNAAIDALSSYRLTLTQSPGRALVASHNIKLWPLYTLALLKSISFRAGLSTKLDDRVYAMCELKTLPTRALIAAIYPDLYPVHDLNETGGLNVDDEVIPQPPRLQLSAEYLQREGAYLADTGSRMVMYVRNGISTDWLSDVLDVPAGYGAMPHLLHELPELDNQRSRLLNAFVKHLNSSRPYQSPLVIIREDSSARSQFTQLLVEDRTEGNKSYVEFIQFLAGSVK